MARLSALRSSSLLRPFLRQQTSLSSLLFSPKNKLSNPPSSPSTLPFSLSSLAVPSAACFFSSFSSGSRTFSSDSESPSNMIIVNSEDQLNESLRKAADESSQSILYFTAVWCGPCRFLWPDIKKLSETLPDVKFYKIDIDEVGGGSTLSKLDISSVPTLHFFKNGKKAAEVVGADPRKIKDITASLYKRESAK